jgi:hypothetical protein
MEDPNVLEKDIEPVAGTAELLSESAEKPVIEAAQATAPALTETTALTEANAPAEAPAFAETSATAGEDNRKSGKKLTVKRDVRSYILFFGIMIFVAAVVVCVLMLLPKKNPNAGNGTDNGIARSFMFPFVFTDERSNLYVLKSGDAAPDEIDDSVEEAVHVAGSGTVMYLREKELFEYDISGGRRRLVASDVKEYSLSGDGSLIVYMTGKGSLVCSSGKKVTELASAEEGAPEILYTVGQSCVVFLRDCDAAAGIAELCRYTVDGGVKSLAGGVSMYHRPGVSSGDKYYYCREGSDLLIMNARGSVLDRVAGGVPVPATKSVSMYENVTDIKVFDGNAPVTFLYSEPQISAASENGASDRADNSVSLLYFNGKTSSVVAGNIYRVIYAATDHKLLIYSVKEGESERVYRVNNKGKAEEIITFDAVRKSFLYDPDSDYLYFQDQEGALYRLNVYNPSKGPSLVSESSATLYKYPNKPFVVFTLPDSDKAVLVHSTNSIQQFGASDEARLYGSDDEKYLLLRSHGYGAISVDLADGDYYTRISSDAEFPLFFDGRLEKIIYVSGGVMHYWEEGRDRALGEYGKVSAAPVA